MKVEVITKEKQFEPIELKLTIESKRELQQLRDHLGMGSHSYELFKTLDNLLTELK